MDPTSVPKIRKPELKVKKPKGSDINWSNLWGNQVTHFAGYTESPNVNNSSCNHYNAKTTSNVGPTICVSFAKEGKTQVRWATAIGWKAWRWARTNNIPPNGSPCKKSGEDPLEQKHLFLIGFYK